MNTTTNGRLVECLERFTFKNGVRLAWVTYRILGDGNPRAVSVREYLDANGCPTPRMIAD